MLGQDLQKLMDLIGSVYVFNEESYPTLKGKTETEKFMFAINHSLLHMQKSIGVLATQCEDYDHHGFAVVNKEALETAVVMKTFINVLKLAEELGMTGKQLFQKVTDFYKK